MNKIGWLICLIIFVFVTVFVLSLDSTTTGKKVRISNQSFEITNESTELVNSNEKVKINLGRAKVSNSDLAASNTDINLNSSGINVQNSDNINNNEVNYNSSDTDYSNNSDFSNQSNSYNNSDYDYNNQNTKGYNLDNTNFKNLDDSHLNAMLNDAKNPNKRLAERNAVRDRYMYKNIDWSTWKSNFVNRILDDSLNIRELDQYEEGSWFYYSFDVNSDGSINNISVKSMYLSPEVKAKVARLIKSYEYQDVTVFPAHTQRKSSKIQAVMMLSNSTHKSSPKDFEDFEQVKIHLKD